MHIVGSFENPILVCRKGDVPDLFNDQFWELYDAWEKFNIGMGLPTKMHYSDCDPEYIRIIIQMEKYYRSHFSNSVIQIKYLEALLKRADVALEIFTKKRRKRG